MQVAHKKEEKGKKMERVDLEVAQDAPIFILFFVIFLFGKVGISGNVPNN